MYKHFGNTLQGFSIKKNMLRTLFPDSTLKTSAKYILISFEKR